MASGDYLDLAESACRTAQLDLTDTTGDLAQAKAKVNEAYLVSCGAGLDFDFLEQEGSWTTTAGSDTYTYASIATAMSISGASIAEIETLTNDSSGYGGQLEQTTWQGLERLSASSQDGDATGTPQFWAKWNGRIRLYPSPDAAYEIGTFARLAPAAMSSDTDTPLVPLAYRHRLLVSYAAAALLRQEGGGEAHNDAQMNQRQYDEAFLAMRTAHASARPSNFRLFGPGWNDDRATLNRSDPYWWTA